MRGCRLKRYYERMNDENPYASPSSSPTDASSGYRLETDVVLPLTETVVFDAVLLSKHEQSMAGCVRPALRAAAIVVGLAAGVFAVGLLVSINRANDLDAPAVVAVIGMVFGIPAVALIAYHESITKRARGGVSVFFSEWPTDFCISAWAM